VGKSSRNIRFPTWSAMALTSVPSGVKTALWKVLNTSSSTQSNVRHADAHSWSVFTHATRYGRASPWNIRKQKDTIVTASVAWTGCAEKVRHMIVTNR
jgi:hypothetical protein